MRTRGGRRRGRAPPEAWRAQLPGARQPRSQARASRALRVAAPNRPQPPRPRALSPRVPAKTTVQTAACAYWVFHYAKRIAETYLVHV